ncbi:hypothetical protein HBI63_018410 [Parastagonospora nodorum]|nr:hypothetical protein HBI63_018410 [Parastagonospora nodorum]
MDISEIAHELELHVNHARNIKPHKPNIHFRNEPARTRLECHRILYPATMPQTLYPRGTVKKIVKAHANRPLSKNVDVLIFLNYALFMQELINEASIKSKQSGERGISARSVKRVSETTLRKYKG